MESNSRSCYSSNTGQEKLALLKINIEALVIVLVMEVERVVSKVVVVAV